MNERTSSLSPRLLGAASLMPRLYLPLLLALGAAWTWRALEGGDDVWAHAAVGRWIWNHFEAPSQTLFLWGREPSSWVAHSWLSQLVFYGLMQSGGPRLVLAFAVCLVALTFALLWRLWTRRAPLSGGTVSVFAPLFFALAISVSALRFRPRPELFSALFLVLLLAFLIAWSEDRIGDWQPLPRAPEIVNGTTLGLAFVFVLWANFHGAFAIGLLLLAVTVLCDAAQDRFDRRAWSLLAAAVLCLLATLCNPYGIGLWREVARSVGSNTLARIDEWQPPLWEPKLWWNVAGEALLALGAVWAWWRNPQRRWSQLAWVLVMGVLFLRQRRHLWLLAIVCLAVMAANASSFDTQLMWKAWRRRTRQPQLLGIPAGLQLLARAGALGILLVCIAIALPAGGAWRGVSPRVPVAMAAQIERRQLPGRLFNDYENSSYLQWALNGPAQSGPFTGQVLSRGRYPLYIDLLNAYPDGLTAEYVKIIRATPNGRRLLQQRGVRCVALGADKRKSGLAKFLDRDTHWKRIYARYDGAIWLRR